MKTIFDAVNEFKGEWPYKTNGMVESKGGRTCYEKGELSDYYCDNPDRLNLVWFNFTCNKKGFNALVDAMSTNFGECAYSDLYINGVKTPLEPIERCWEIDSDKLAEVFKKADALDKKVSNTYTQEMHDKDEVTPVGCEVVLNLIKGAEGVTSDDLSHNGETMRVVALTQHKLPVLLNETNFFCYVCNNAHFKPLTPPVPLIDGKAYQFEFDGEILYGLWNEETQDIMCTVDLFTLSDVTNIQPLTLAGE